MKTILIIEDEPGIRDNIQDPNIISRLFMPAPQEILGYFFI
jgi:hypothetical protein